jgi:RHS repeat-associated protein
VLGNLTYEYDKAGNRTRIGGTWARTGIPDAINSATYNAANHQTAFGNKSLTYDNNGNLQSITDPGGTTTYTWNARNQLGGISGPGVSASFVYDGTGRREKKTIGGNLTEFLFSGFNPVQETSGANVLANILPATGIDEFLTRTDTVAGSTSNFLTDHLGSPVALTDNASTVQTEYSYEPFGKTTTTGASNTNSYQFTGRENDGIGLYYYRARHYHPVLQRFISEVPIRFRGGDVNLFAYVRNRPLNARDPLGLWYPPSHRDYSRRAAGACGMSEGEADALAEATAAPDFSIWPLPSLSTLNPWSAKHGMPESAWWSYFRQQFDLAVSTGSLVVLGRALHAVQDAYAHDIAGVGMMDHFNPFRARPDNPRTPENEVRSQGAYEASVDAVRDYRRARGDKPTCNAGGI